MNTSTPQTDQLITLRTAEYDSLYEHIVKPDRALYLSGYYARWIRHIGPELAWMYVAFRQAAYMDGGRTGSSASRITVAEIAARAGISRRAYQNRASNPFTWEELHGLVTRVDEEPQWTNASGTPRQLPSQFVVAMTLPLTPADVVSLTNWLLNNKQNYGGVESVLRAASEAPLKELIPLNADTLGEPVTVRALIQNLFGDQLDAKLLDVLAAAIQNHIMPPNDQIKISVFFMEHILAHLGAGPGWVVTLMRDRCFDGESETRNRVVVKGGYAEIASWLGINRVKTAWEWQHQKKDGKYINPIFNLYLREQVDERNYDNGDRIFHVLLEEIPFEMLEAFAMGRGMDVGNADIEQVGNFNLGMSSDGAIFSPALAESASTCWRILHPTLAQTAPTPWRNLHPTLAQTAQLKLLSP